MHLDNGAIEEAIGKYKHTGSTAALSTVLTLARERIQTLIRFNATARYVSEPELVADVNYKIIRSIHKFDSARGSGFTFVSMLALNVLRSNVTAARKLAARTVPLDETVINSLPENTRSRDGERLEDVADKVRREAKSALCLEEERATQRWYIQSFCVEGFEARRHSCANAAVRAFGLDHGRAREVFDLSMLEVRRVLFDDLKRHKPVISRLRGTHCFWMTKLRPLLSDIEFAKFYWLMRGLSPGTIFLIHPQNRSRRVDRNRPVTRESLLWILDGHPLATRLFPEP